jgi:outer membrane protein OmpA-like peptidoglycan-associated protein
MAALLADEYDVNKSDANSLANVNPRTNDYENIVIDSNAAAHIIFHDAFSAVIYLLDATSIALLSRCNKYLKALCNNSNVVSWISQPRTIGFKSLTCIEHLKIFELISKAEISIHFDWGSVQVEDACYPYLEQIVKIMKQHETLKIRVEGHCGLEAPEHIAIDFSSSRAASVCGVLANMGIEQRRISHIGHGKSQPKVCACGPFSRNAKKNRRTEIFLRDENGVEFPTREPLPNISEEEIQVAIAEGGKKQLDFQVRIDRIMAWKNRLDEAVLNEHYVNNPREDVVALIRVLGSKSPDSLTFYEHMNEILDEFEKGLLNNAADFMAVVLQHIALVEQALEPSK